MSCLTELNYSLTWTSPKEELTARCLSCSGVDVRSGTVSLLYHVMLCRMSKVNLLHRKCESIFITLTIRGRYYQLFSWSCFLFFIFTLNSSLPTIPHEDNISGTHCSRKLQTQLCDTHLENSVLQVTDRGWTLISWLACIWIGLVFVFT